LREADVFEPDETLQAFTKYKDRDAFPSGKKIVIWMVIVLALVALAIYLL
jgi:hypothetical protein